KRPTTARGWGTGTRMPASLLLAVCWLSANVCPAQETIPIPEPPPMSLPPVHSPVPAARPVSPSAGVKSRAAGLPKPAAAAAQAVTQPPTQPLPPRPGMRPGEDVSSTFRVRLDLPGPEELFRLDSEATLFLRMKEEAREKTPPERITFP